MTESNGEHAVTGGVDLSHLTVVIPTWNTADLTIRCAHALIDDGVPPQRIVLVDNGSTDGSYEHLAQNLPDCRLIRFEQNLGYGRAMNAGARDLPGAAYLLMNNDAFVHGRGSVVRLLSVLDDPTIGLVFPRYRNEDLTLQPSVLPTHSPLSALVRASGLSRFVPNRWAARLTTHWDHGESREIECAVGAVMLFRGETWQQLRGFDERIYIYAEEIDICWRTREHGWRIWFTTDSEFIHLGNSSAGKQWSNPTREHLIGASESVVIRRHLSRVSAAATLALITAGIGARLVVSRALGRRAAADAYMGALRGYLGREAPARSP